MASHADNGEFGFQIAPMLDVLFVLLLFFMVTAGVQKREGAIATPLASLEAPGSHVEVNIEITDDGQILFNGIPTDLPANHPLPETTDRLKAAIADAPDRPIIIRPEAGTRHERVVDVLNACVAVHAQNVAFGALSD
jgi:biopolymer transport protein ExbD